MSDNDTHDGLSDNAPWEDKDDEWTSAIHDAFPTRSGSHKEYAIARRMVGNRHGKGALIDLVNWLLVRAKDEFRDHIEAKLLSAEARIAELEIIGQNRIAALEDTIDLERAQLRSWRNAGGDPHVLAIISEIEYRRGAGWKGAR